LAQERKQQALAAKGLQDRVIHIARVAKVVKGGRRFSFSALVCIGDGISQVGYGVGKAGEVPDAIRKASADSQKTLMDVPLVEDSIPYEVVGKFGSSRVHMYPAPQGKGIIAGAAARVIFDLCGIKNIVCKIHGSRNHHNVVRATFNGLSQLKSIEDYASMRKLSPDDVLSKRVQKKKKLLDVSSFGGRGLDDSAPASVSNTKDHQNKKSPHVQGAKNDKVVSGKAHVDDQAEQKQNMPSSEDSSAKSPEELSPSVSSEVKPSQTASVVTEPSALQQETKEQKQEESRKEHSSQDGSDSDSDAKTEQPSSEPSSDAGSAAAEAGGVEDKQSQDSASKEPAQ